MRILYDNILTSDVTLGQLLLSGYNDEDSLTSRQLADAVRTTVTSTVTFEWDLGASPPDYDSAGLAGINLTNSATVVVKTGTTPGFAVAANTFTLLGSPEKYLSFGSTISDRYVRFEITDTGNTDGFLQFGRFMVGPEYQHPGFAPTVTSELLIAGTASRSQSGQLYGVHKYNTRQLTITIPSITATQKVDVDTFLGDVGFAKTFIVHLDESCFDFGFTNLHVSRQGDSQSFELNEAKVYTTTYTVTEAF